MKLFLGVVLSCMALWLLYGVLNTDTKVEDSGEQRRTVYQLEQQNQELEAPNNSDSVITKTNTQDTEVLDEFYFGSDENFEQINELGDSENTRELNDSKRKKLFFRSFRRLLKERDLLTYEDRKNVVRLLGSVFESLQAERMELNSLLEEVLILHDNQTKFSEELFHTAGKYRKKREQFYGAVITGFEKRLEELGLQEEVKKSVVIALQEVLEKQIVVP